MKQLIIGKITFVLFISMLSASTYTMEAGKDATPLISEVAEKISIEKILPSKKEDASQANSEGEKLDEMQEIEKAVQKFDEQFGKNTNNITININTPKQNLAAQFIQQEQHAMSAESLIHEFLTSYNQNPEIINEFMTYELNTKVNNAATTFVQKLTSISNNQNPLALFHDCVDLVLSGSSMEQTGLMLVVTEFAIAKAIKKIISLSFAPATATVLREVVDSTTIDVVHKTIDAYCPNEENAKILKSITKQILKPKEKVKVDGNSVAKIVLSKIAKL